MNQLQILRQRYEVEHELAERLRHSSRAERPALLNALYAELLSRTPEHPRLAPPPSPAAATARTEARLRLLQPWLKPMPCFLEFAPGDGSLAMAMCRWAAKVYAVDISNQLPTGLTKPANFQQLIYDGFNLDLPDSSVDLAFSYQVLEHLHPDDVPLHFALAHRLLRPGGCYVFATPHAFSGPHDVSRHFSLTPMGLHLKEWTYQGIIPLLENSGLTEWRICRRGRYRNRRTARRLQTVETLLHNLPLRLRRICSRRYFAGIIIAAGKPA